MKKNLLILLILFPLSGFCQDEFLARLPIRGAVSEIGISPSEKLWIATKSGNTYYTEKIENLWHFGPFGTKDPLSETNGGIFERINFFSEDIMIISGFIHGENSNQDFVYRSTDKGLTWEKIKFGKSSWIDAAYINDKGKAWMSGSSQLIYYTQDSGKTWEQLDKIEETGNLRFSTIHFSKDEKVGLFGSFWNKIYKTIDNCKTWEKVPTPLSQNKYSTLSKNDRPEIRKIRTFGNYYLVNQQGRIFYTKTDNIDWVELPKISDFEVSEDESVYLIDNDLKIELRNSDFTPIWKSKKALNSSPSAISVKNKSIFALTFDEIYKINQSEFIVSKLLTDEVEISEPYLKLNYQKEEFGFERNSVLKFDQKTNKWYKFMELPFYVSNAVIFHDKIIISDETLINRFILDTDNKKIVDFKLPKSLFDLSPNYVQKFSIEIGSQGCFHSDRQFKEYQLTNKAFILNAFFI